MPLSYPAPRISIPVFLEDTTGHIIPALVAANAATYSQTLAVVTVTSTAHNMTATLNGKNVYLGNATVTLGVAPTGFSGNWFSNFTYINANSFSCTATNSQTGTGTILTNTSATTISTTGTLPAGALGLNGFLDYELVFSNNNSAGTKTAGVAINSTGITATASTTNTTGYVRKSMKLMNSLTKQTSPPQSLFGPSATTVGVLTQAHALGSDAALTVTGTLNTASDWMAIEFATISGRRFV